MEFSNILPSHQMTIPTLLMLFESHSLSLKTPVKTPYKVLHISTTIVAMSVVIHGNSFTYDSTSNLVHDSPNVFDPPSQPPFYSFGFYGNDDRYGHYCTPQVSFIYPEPCYNQDFKFPQDFHNFQQQDLCCENCGVAHEAYQFTPSLSTNEPDNSLSMADEHLDTILATKSDEFIKSSFENLVPILSESEGIPDNMCDVPFHDNSLPLHVLKDQFEDFSDSNDDSTSNDDDSLSIDNIEYVEASPPILSSSAQRLKTRLTNTSASWEAPHAYP
nr:hypothetical protein [Tanacetum cinerariifolium]